MPAIVPWRPRETAGQVIRHLAEGKCVVLPTEATYELVASALNPEAVSRGAEFGQPAIVLLEYAALSDWMPLLRGAGRRLMRKLGPAPVTLTAKAGFRFGLWRRLPDETGQRVACAERLAVRWPLHAIWDELRHSGFPLVSVPLVSAKMAEEAAQLVGESAACVVDAGPCELGMPPCVIEADGGRCRLLGDGLLTQDALEKLTVCRVLFVCTGNTCRSPMAQALCVKLLADRLGCPVEELRERGFLVQSAGLAAMMGAAASPEAVEVAREHGAYLSGHKSSMASLEMLRWADHVFAMTASHWYTLLSIAPPGFVEPRLLSPQLEDIADPIGGPISDYRSCARQILECLEQRLPELLES